MRTLTPLRFSCFLVDHVYVTVELIVRVVVSLSICYGCIVAKRCEVEPKLLLITIGSHRVAFKCYENL